jgi:DNA-binding CsgD family transcriptional regulator
MASELARVDANFAGGNLPIPNGSGLVVVDRALKVVASNTEAIRILTFPTPPEKISDLENWLTKQIRGSLVDRVSSAAPTLVGQFQSARRTYHCRSFPLNVNGSTRSPHRPALVLLLDRNPHEVTKIAEVCARFGMTPREQVAVRLLFEGLTTKEIAHRMKISPNTVKAFLRLIMVKMGVSTRSGIIGKIASSKR